MTRPGLSLFLMPAILGSALPLTSAEPPDDNPVAAYYSGDEGYPAWTDRFRAWFVAGLIVQLVLLLGTSEGIVGDELSELLLDGGVFCWGLLLCLLQVGVLLRATRGPGSAAVSSG